MNGEPEVRNGFSLHHTMREGSSVKFLDPSFLPRIAVIAHPDHPPYFLYADGSTEEFEFHV